MKPRLILIVLSMVVLPTALLSFMANRALRSREDLLQYRLKIDAADAIKVVSRRVQARFDDDMEHVLAVVSECIARGGKNADIEAASARLRNSRGTINRLYLFMDPWGFIFPEPGTNATARMDPKIETKNSKPASGARSTDSLVSALRREVALRGSQTTALMFTMEDASYWFSVLPDRKDLYAGFEINPVEFIRELSNTLKAASGEVFALIAEGPGINSTNTVVVSDVFGERTEVSDKRPDLAEEPVAVGRLMKPFDYVNIKAFVVDQGRIKKAAELRYRLYAWGIILLAVGICTGLFLVLREAAEEIRMAKMRSDFVIGVSHDLRTPVASMRMLAESLYLDHVEGPDQQKKFLRVIVRESERLSQLIERVLFFVRMDQKSLVYRFGEVDIGKLVAVTVEAFKTKVAVTDQKAEIRIHHLSIGSSIEPGLQMVRADESAISQVILNLLDNAVKYSKKDMEDRGQKMDVGDQKSISKVPLPESPGKMQAAYRAGLDFGMWTRAERRGTVQPPSILMTVSAVDDSFRHFGFMPRRRWVKILVTDHGIGIEKNELRKIFRRFYRVKGSTGSNISGVGLGLALCRHVAQAHGGWIEVESEIGKGSAFSVYLPFRV